MATMTDQPVTLSPEALALLKEIETGNFADDYDFNAPMHSRRHVLYLELLIAHCIALYFNVPDWHAAIPYITDTGFNCMAECSMSDPADKVNELMSGLSPTSRLLLWKELSGKGYDMASLPIGHLDTLSEADRD